MTTDAVMPCLWFDGTAEEAARHYCAVIPGSAIRNVVRQAGGAAFVVEFDLGGRSCLALNGRQGMGFTHALSLVVTCADQAELDRVWDGLVEGGAPQRCGWLTDRYGVSWQVVPAGLGRMMRQGEEAQRGRLMAALMPMVKLDIATLEAAWAAKEGADA
ncbi:VOC family protein [Roseomonas eburnea]|uniref:VOC family protein n=1 Tax=Neoroseomonas eburnea TaxID=1346889 RepID=A0A9X9X8W0_9PROT|nr:VOC family protein [Neoroseomonas eburnea]MBR0680146.1 VOC family protein [Neoroseomonas eburnea]